MATKKRKKKANKWIQGNPEKGIEPAVKHKGAVKAAAKRHGKSVLEEAKAESHSKDKRVAARGRLALRFKGAAKRGNIKKKHHVKRTAVKA